MPSWKKFNLDDFHISKGGKPYLFARLNTRGLRGVQPTTKAVFFPHKVTDEGIVVVPSDIVKKLESDLDWKVNFPAAIEEFKVGKSVLEEIEGMPIDLDKFSLLSQAIQSENETVIFYQNLQDMFPEWRDVLQDIINEELKHIGQFEALRDASSVTVATKVEQGQNEADAQMHGIAVEGLEKDLHTKDVNAGVLTAMKELGQLLGKSEEIDPIVEKGFVYLKNKKSATESIEKRKIVFKGKIIK